MGEGGEVSMMGLGQVSTGAVFSSGLCSWLLRHGLLTRLGSHIEKHQGLEDHREMALGDFGVEGGAAAEEEMILMILHHLIQAIHVGSLHQVERHLVSDKPAGDPGSG